MSAPFDRVIHAASWHPRRRWLRIVEIVLLAIVVFLIAAAFIAYRAAPSVDDAEKRAKLILIHHVGRDAGLPVPSRVAAATVAIEDRRFYDHGALDVRGLGRALWSTIAGGGRDPGGSTITQQLAKVAYGGSGGAGKLRDIALAFKLERRYSKQQILELYLNSVYYGHGAYGIDAASRTYFGKPPALLDWAEASLLAGLLQAPSAFDPVHDFARARVRQRVVLRALVETDRLTPGAARTAYDELRSLRR